MKSVGIKVPGIIDIASQGIGSSLPLLWWLAGEINPANCIAAYQPIRAISQAASYINLANPGTYDATPGVAPTWNGTDGWIFNGSTQYLATGLIPSSNYSGIIKFSNYVPSAAGGVIFGGYRTATTRFYIFPQRSNVLDYKQFVYGDGSYDTAIGTGVADGVLCLSGNLGYYNSAFDGDTTGTWGGAGVASHIGAFNDRDISAILFSQVYIQAFAFYNVAITLSQISAVTTAMNAL